MMLENGGSRLFIQTTEPLQYTISDKGLKVTVSFDNAKVYLSNNRNPLVTSYFNTPLQRAYLKKRNKQLDLILELKVSTSPKISSESDSDGYRYLFVDFAPGDYPIDTSPVNPSFFGTGRAPAEQDAADLSPSDTPNSIEKNTP